MMSTARLLASSTKEFGCWLKALGVTSLGTLLDDFSFRTAVKLRLGARICQPHTCVCEAPVGVFGCHGLTTSVRAGSAAAEAEGKKERNTAITRAITNLCHWASKHSAPGDRKLSPLWLKLEDGWRKKNRSSAISLVCAAAYLHRTPKRECRFHRRNHSIC